MPTQTGSLDLKSGNDAAKTATNYITEISTTDGIKVHNVSDTSNYAQINSSGMNVVQSGVSVASFGASARVGKESGGHTTIQTSGMQIYGSDGTEQLANIGYGDGTSSTGAIASAPYYTFGTRQSGYAIGNYSFVAGVSNVSSGYAAHAEGQDTIASAYCAHAEGLRTTANKQSAHAEGQYTIASGFGAHAEGFSNPNTYTITASESGAHAEGYAVYGNILASGLGAHAEGGATTASGDYSHAEGSKTTASNAGSHAEGVTTTASGLYSHAEGDTTTASGYSAHAEGLQTTASGSSSHAEGIHTVAEGDHGAHAEGYYTTASGDYSHAQNYHTTAGYSYQTAIGYYNDNTAGNLFEIGNGTWAVASNAFSVDSSGNVVCAGTVIDSSGRTLLSAETDPTVPSWAKASTKPSYSASEISGLIDMFYPVGSYYETSDTTFNPNTAWGGTWSLETEGQVHISAGSNYSVSGALTNTTDGGEATHTLQKTEIPNFEGSVYIRGYKTSSSSSRAAIAHGGTGIISVGAVGTNTANGIMAAGGIADLGSNPLTVSFGGGQAHNNMQPYIAVNRWHRTA